jgi:hypothetical protein
LLLRFPYTLPTMEWKLSGILLAVSSVVVARLTGRPLIERGEGRVVMPRGRKSWAVLAYVALAEVPVTRERLASLLFGDAADPLGALRWTLAELRRSLGANGVLRGDPVRLDLPAGFMVDALELSRGQAEPGLVRGGLLEGIEVDAGPVFDAWLLVERRRLAGLCEGVLRDAALAVLAAGRARDAAALVSRALGFSRSRTACTSCWCAAWRRPVISERRDTPLSRARCCFVGSWAARRTRASLARPIRLSGWAC